MPAVLAREVRRVAKERKVTMSRALVTLAEWGVEAEAAARARLTAAYDQFMAEGDPGKKSEIGEDLIRSIFGRSPTETVTHRFNPAASPAPSAKPFS